RNSSAASDVYKRQDKTMGKLVGLKGIRILDLSVGIAGPFASQILGDLGAEIIKIEQPGLGDIARGAAPQLQGESFYHLAVNRNKKSVELDLSTDLGKTALHDLSRISDAVLDNYRPGVLKRLGAEYETLRAINPMIVSCTITGYGDSGPYCQYPAFDDMAEGISGVYSMSGESEKRPVRLPVPIADLAAGVFAAIAILFGVIQREKVGAGCKLSVSLLDAVMFLLETNFQTYFITGEAPRPRGRRHPISPMVGIFETKNGHIVLGPSWPRIARLIGKEWMMHDPRFSTVEARFKNKDDLEDLIEEGLREADSEDWLELMHAEDVAAGPLNTLEKAIQDPQVIHNKTVVILRHPLCGEVRNIECPIRLERTETIGHSPPPLLGQHTDEVLRDLLGYSDEQITRLKEQETANRELKRPVRRRL
ncbi:MAG: CoA transferase, partial [Dehalococcoidia bacterium]|nr:CoA transferase [Dehalococcoidia bacterium]